MPTYRKRPVKKTRAPKKADTWRSYAGKALTLASNSGIKALKKKLGLNTENKNWDTVLGAVPTANFLSSFLFPMSNIAQGTSNQQRNGNGLRCTHLKFRGTLTTVGAPNVSHQRVRIIWTINTKVVIPGSFTTPAQLLQNVNNIDSPYNTDLQDCKVLFDKTYLITPYTAQVAQLPIKFKWDPSYDDGHVQWTDADVAGLGLNMTQGLIQMFAMTDQAANPPTVSGYARVHFVDN